MLDSAIYGQVCTQWKEPARIGALQSVLHEASGVAASRKVPGRLYHINDSGDTGRFFITSMAGKDTRPINIAGFDPVDVEAISLGPCSGGGSSCLYLGDIGDNDKNRKSIEIAVVDEFETFPQTVKARQRMTLRYPDGPHDAESLAVHPDGTIYILVKESPARLFKADPHLTTQVLTPVTTLDPGAKPTDMAFSDDGNRLLVLTYIDAVEYSIDFKHQQKIKLNFLQQQEGVTYLPGSRSFIYTTEQLLPILPQWIMRVDCGDN
ncbi:MAG TPA: hypothetical protein VGK48_07095 [Terriglobia bacterium]